jgi:hypothetical protein
MKPSKSWDGFARKASRQTGLREKEQKSKNRKNEKTDPNRHLGNIRHNESYIAVW